MTLPADTTVTVERIERPNAHTLHMYIDDESTVGAVNELLDNLLLHLELVGCPVTHVCAATGRHARTVVEISVSRLQIAKTYWTMVKWFKPTYTFVGTVDVEVRRVAPDPVAFGRFTLKTEVDFPDETLDALRAVAHVESALRHSRTDSLSVTCDYNDPDPIEVIDTARLAASQIRMYLTNYHNMPVVDYTKKR